MTTLPAAVQYASVVGTIITAEADSLDPDLNPDRVPATGKLTFIPTVKLLISSSSKTVISPKPITIDLQSDGSFEAILVANEQADLLPFEWGYTLTFQLTGVTISPITFKVLPGQNVDLVDIVQIPTPSGVDMMRGPAGRGIVSISDPDSGGIVTITYSDNTTSQFSIIQVVGGEGGTTDHGALWGLGDDDHTQYALADGTRGDFAALSHDHVYQWQPPIYEDLAAVAQALDDEEIQIGQIVAVVATGT